MLCFFVYLCNFLKSTRFDNLYKANTFRHSRVFLNCPKVNFLDAYAILYKSVWYVWESPASHTHIQPRPPGFLPLIKLQPAWSLTEHSSSSGCTTDSTTRRHHRWSRSACQELWAREAPGGPGVWESTACRPRFPPPGLKTITKAISKAVLLRNASDTLPSPRWTRSSLFKLHRCAWMSKI